MLSKTHTVLATSHFFSVVHNTIIKLHQDLLLLGSWFNFSNVGSHLLLEPINPILPTEAEAEAYVDAMFSFKFEERKRNCEILEE